MLPGKVRQYNVACLIIFILLVATIIFLVEPNILWSKRYVVHWKPLVANVSCHYSMEGDALPSAEAPGFAPAPRSIFFHETSCRGGLNSRQACAVESAARAHPHRQVHVLFSAPTTAYVLRNSVLALLQNFPNIKLARVHIVEYAKGIFAMDILDRLKSSKYSISHTSDILRIVSLRKWSGVYLDTDLVVMRSLDSLPPNWTARQADDEVAFGVLALSNDKTGRNITAALINEMSETYDPGDYVGNGPGLITQVMEDLCPEALTIVGENCNDFYIFDKELFYPVYYRDAEDYFDPENQNILNGSACPYMHHMWNGLTWHLNVHKHSPYAKLARKFCPSVYNLYGNEFGV